MFASKASNEPLKWSTALRQAQAFVANVR